MLITGAAGAVIGRVLPMLREEYDLVLLDVYDTDGAGRKIEGIQKADLVNPNRDDYRDYFKGADVVIHTAYLFSQRMNAQDPSWLSPGKAGDPCWCMPSVIITTASGASGMPGEAAVFAVSGGPAPMILLPVESRPLFEPLPVKIVRFVDKAVIWV